MNAGSNPLPAHRPLLEARVALRTAQARIFLICSDMVFDKGTMDEVLMAMSSMFKVRLSL